MRTRLKDYGITQIGKPVEKMYMKKSVRLRRETSCCLERSVTLQLENSTRPAGRAFVWSTRYQP